MPRSGRLVATPARQQGQGMARQIRAAILDAHGDSGRPQHRESSGSLLDDGTTTAGSSGTGAEDLVDEPVALGRAAGGVGLRGALAGGAVLQGDEERVGSEQLPSAGLQGGRRVGAGVLRRVLLPGVLPATEMAAGPEEGVVVSTEDEGAAHAG